MANIDWYVEGLTYGNCNCNHSCPCQFEDRPSNGNCQGFEVLRIDKGHFGDTDLSGLKLALLYSWPGAIFEGNGEMQAIIDERADEAQRHALQTVVYGGETDEAATHWWVFHAMSSTVHEPLFKPIEYEVDLEARTARIVIPGVLESTGEPIRNPVDGAEHRVRIDIPDGIEFELAEIGNASTKADAAIKLDLKDSYGQWNELRHAGSGVQRTR